jgi:hypothetical protein
VNVIWIGAFVGDDEKLDAGKLAARIQNGNFKMKLLRINSQQNDFRRSVTRHLMTTEVLERLVKDAEGCNTDAEEDVTTEEHSMVCIVAF